MNPDAIPIKPRPGDICPDGSIFMTGGTALRSGVVAIRVSRLRRAMRFGWKIHRDGYLPGQKFVRVMRK